MTQSRRIDIRPDLRLIMQLGVEISLDPLPEEIMGIFGRQTTRANRAKPIPATRLPEKGFTEVDKVHVM